MSLSILMMLGQRIEMPVRKTLEEEAWLTTVSERIRAARAAAGLTQVALAEMTNLSVDMVSRVERGDREPGLAVCRRLAGALSVDLGELLADSSPVSESAD